MIAIWLIFGAIGYFLIKTFRRPILDGFDMDYDLLVLMFMGLGVISLLASAHFIFKSKL